METRFPTPGKAKPRSARRSRATVEALESRLLLTATPDNQNQNPTAWLYYSGVDANFLTGLTNQGYRITDLSLNPGSTSLFTATLVQNTGTYSQGWWWYLNQTPAQLGSLATSLNARITDVEPYFVGTQLEFAALLTPNTGSDNKAWWWYYNDSLSDISSQLTANNGRLIDLKPYDAGGVTKYAVTMIANTGADNRAWWWYYNETPDQINSLLTQNSARLVDVQQVDPGHFDVIMQQDPGVEWWWYYGVDVNGLGKLAAQDGARIFNLEPYLDASNNLKFAAILINNSDAVTTTVGNILRGASPTASSGLYLKQVGGSVLESLQSDTQFEPASMIKAVLNLTAMRAVQAGTISLTTPLWMYYSPSNPYVDFNNPGNPNENPDSYADTTSNRVSLPLNVLLSRMMEISDNRATKSIETEFGIPAINSAAQLAGMTNTVFASTLGSGIPGNYLTLDDAGKLYEGVLNQSLLNATNAAQFFDNMSDQPDAGETEAIPIADSIFQPFQTDVSEEAAKVLGLPQNDAMVTALSNAFIAQMKGAWKGGSYTLYANSTQWALDLTAGGYLGLPFVESNSTVNLQDYVYGIFINNALVPQNPYPNSQSQAVSDAWNNSQQELLRQVIHDALATWRINPHLVVTNLNDSGPGSLRAAIQVAQASIGTATITFAPGLSGSLYMNSGQFELLNPYVKTVISGPGAGVLTIRAQGHSRIFQVDAGVTASISGLSIADGAAVFDTSGGGIYDAGTLTLQGSTVTGAYAEGGGGGIYVAAGAILDMLNCTVYDNTARFGGGISDNGTLVASNCTIANNSISNIGPGGTGSGLGGGIYDAGIATLRNVTIADNQATQGGGIFLAGGAATLYNTIVAQNLHGTSTPDDIVGTLVFASANNLIGTGGSGGLGNTDGNIVGVANPGLAPLGDYGGPTKTVALLGNSPAVDHGTNSLALDPSGNALIVDQRGFGRSFNSKVDIGAFEQVPGDANFDGQVNFADLVIVARNYGKSGISWGDGDFTGDGKVGFDDLVVLARNYGKNDGLLALAALSPTLQTLPAIPRHHR